MQGQNQTEATMEVQKQPDDRAEIIVAAQEQALDEPTKVQPSGSQTSINSRRGVQEFDWFAVGIVLLIAAALLL